MHGRRILFSRDQIKDLINKMGSNTATLSDAIFFLRDKEDFLERGVTSVGEYLNVVTNISDVFNNNYKFLYRGENCLYKTPLIPSLLREAHESKSPWDLDRIIKEEINNVIRFRDSKIGKNLNQIYPGILSNQDSVFWWFLTQHFSAEIRPKSVTRLIDVSSDPLIGLFFAINNPENDRYEGWVHIIHSEKNFGEPCSSYSTFQDHINDELNYYGEQVYYRFNTDEMKLEDHLSIPRIDKQRGEFLFYKQIVGNTYLPSRISIKINLDYKKDIRKELNMMFSINSESLMNK